MTAPAPEGNGTDIVDPAVPAAGTDPNGTEPTPRKEDTVDHWKAMARKHEETAKANKKAAEELAEIRKSQQTAEERAAEERKQIETEAETLRAENIRLRAATVHGISEENLDLLGTGTEEEIMVRAERIGELEDAANELERLKQQLSEQANQPGYVPLLTPGGASAPPDTSYPTNWFPGLKPRRNTSDNA